MALRSSLSSLARTAPAEEREESVNEPQEAAAPTSRGRVTTPVAETPKSAAVQRGRPRLSDEEKAERTAKPKPPRKAPVKAFEAAAGQSAAALRAALKEVEHEARELKGQMDVAVAKFQPKIDALRSRHAELSAALAHAMFK